MSGIPVIIVEKNGIPVTPVESGAPLLTVSANGLGTPIVIASNATPFVVQGLVPPSWTPDILFDDGEAGHWSGGYAPPMFTPSVLFRAGSPGHWSDINGGLA